MADKKSILEYLRKKDFCVLATATKYGKPEAAVMVFVIDANFSFFLYTETETRKYKNIMQNDLVSLVVGGFENDPTVQIDGIIYEVTPEETKSVVDFVNSLHPEWNKNFVSPSGKWLALKPDWLRYSDFSQSVPEIVEIGDF